MTRVCLCCEKPFTLTRRGGFICPDCIAEIRKEAEAIRAQPLRRWEARRK